MGAAEAETAKTAEKTTTQPGLICKAGLFQ